MLQKKQSQTYQSPYQSQPQQIGGSSYRSDGGFHGRGGGYQSRGGYGHSQGNYGGGNFYPRSQDGGRGGRGGQSSGPRGGGHSSNYKTLLCKNFQNGNCKYGNNCGFAHGEHELKRAPQAPPTQGQPQLMTFNTANFPTLGAQPNGQ